MSKLGEHLQGTSDQVQGTPFSLRRRRSDPNRRYPTILALLYTYRGAVPSTADNFISTHLAPRQSSSAETTQHRPQLRPWALSLLPTAFYCKGNLRATRTSVCDVQRLSGDVPRPDGCLLVLLHPATDFIHHDPCHHPLGGPLRLTAAPAMQNINGLLATLQTPGRRPRATGLCTTYAIPTQSVSLRVLLEAPGMGSEDPWSSPRLAPWYKI